MDEIADEVEDVIKRDLIARMGGDPSGGLTAERLGDLVIVYLNWRGRFVPAFPRAVHLSAELLASPKYVEHQIIVDAIVAKIEAGRDLTPHLSRGTKTVYMPKSRRGLKGVTRDDLDRLIAEWGIHHLHLTDVVESDGYVARTGDLLFAHFAVGHAYLIGVFPHRSWAKRTVAEIIVRNWPEAGLLLTQRASSTRRGGSGLAEARPPSVRLNRRMDSVARVAPIGSSCALDQSCAGRCLGAGLVGGRACKVGHLLDRERLAPEGEHHGRCRFLKFSHRGILRPVG